MHYVRKSLKDSHFHCYESFLPLEKFFLILGDSINTVKMQNLPELHRIYKGPKNYNPRFFFEINVARFAREDETFFG